MTLGFLIVMVGYGIAVGGVARWVVPGPNPMPLWVTSAIGIAGSIIGGVVSKALFGNLGGFVIAVPFSVLLVVGYRKLVAKGVIPRTPQRPPRSRPPGGGSFGGR